ncbi:hypothetical protein GCM10008931_44100 [Oceanobacillus oncorhynchi subsp. oncorhynchi]|uniref:hypothetical protein n=1 Tax=Oceanobacillus oncorhynchi TaxID=545501 RepID=UPI0031D41841
MKVGDTISRKYVCQWCREKDIDENMTIVKIGKNNKRYHKGKCYDLYKKYNESKEREKLELDSLVETIKELHNIEVIPGRFYPFLQDLRNGNEMFGKMGTRKSKAGYPYKIIEKTYLFCQDKINWALQNINADTFGMLKYTKAIVESNIYRIAAQEARKQQHEEVAQLNENETVNMQNHLERKPVQYKKKKSKRDISSLLD